MQQKKRLLSFLLAALMLLSAIPLTLGLTGCKPGGEEITTSTVDTTTPAPAAPATLDLVKDGVCNVTVIRPDAAATDSPAVNAAQAIYKELSTSSGVTAKLATDWLMPGTEYDPNTLEILVGATARDESVSVMTKLGYGDYNVCAVGSKIVVAGYTDTSLSYAASALCNIIRKNVTADGDFKNISIKSEDIVAIGTRSAALTALPHYENGSFYSYYEPFDGGDEIIIGDTDINGYNAYVSKLESAGFVKYTSHEMNGNPFTTLNSDKYTINVGYYGYEKRVRLTIEDKAPAVGLESENVYTAITTPQVTLLGLEYLDSTQSPVGNGLSMLFRLADGRFIVVDGGHTTNNATWAANLMKELKSQSKEYVKSTSEITIAAWIISHAHGDHNGMINKQYNLFKSIKVESFLTAFMSENERMRAVAAGNIESGDGSNYTATKSAIAALGAVEHVIHIGQVFHFADAKLEVLYTMEGYGPTVLNALNTTSTVIKATIAGTVIMITGDATGPGFQFCSRMYGKYLKSDIVQVAHHGYTTWGTESGTISAYRAMAPACLLWPQGLAANPNYLEKSYNIVLWDKAENPNYIETFLAGWGGDTCVVPLPYVPGTGIVTRTKQ